MKIFVMEYGWIICGKEVSRENGMVNVDDASVARRWSNGRGIGGLAKAAYKDEYTLDEIGAVSLCVSKVLFEIPCEWE